MLKNAIHALMRDRWYFYCFVGISTALLLKFLWPLYAFDIPMGYDAGLYRYLFVKHGAAFPPFIIGDVEPWVRGHPLGLFFFTTLLMKIGIPVDWLIGWIWNVFTICLLGVFAWVSAKRFGKWIGLLVLVMGVLSIPYYDGFFSMYWKNYAALLFMVLAMYLLEKRSLWAVIPGLLTLVTHNQTGLLFGLVVASWWVIFMFKERKNPGAWRKPTLVGCAVLAIALVIYLPVFEESIRTHLGTLFTKRGGDAPSGAFPDAFFYLRVYGIALFFGIAGFWISLRAKREFTLWHWAVLWPFVFIVFKLFFYKRFFLQLDFFLLPFAALGVLSAWQSIRTLPIRTFLVVLLLVQAYLSFMVMQERRPEMTSSTVSMIRSLEKIIPDDAYVLSPENISPMWIRGLLPNHRVAGPGLLSLPWEVEKWETILYGENSARRELLQQLQGPLYFVLTPVFFEYYGEHARPLLSDPCLEEVPGVPLLRFICEKAMT